MQEFYKKFSYSEVEIYSHLFSQLSDGEVLNYSDRVCEVIRRGESFRQIKSELEKKAGLSDIEMVRLQIAIATERDRCPESKLPQAQWQRSLLFLWERFNGGTPL